MNVEVVTVAHREHNLHRCNGRARVEPEGDTTTKGVVRIGLPLEIIRGRFLQRTDTTGCARNQRRNMKAGFVDVTKR